VIDGVDAEGWRFVAFVRLVPLFPFNLSNYALGLTRIPLREYVIATLVCMAPGAVAYTWLGHAGRGALSGEASSVRYGLLGLGLLAAIAVLPRLIRRLRGSFAWIEANELKHRIDQGDPVAVIDARQPSGRRLCAAATRGNNPVSTPRNLRRLIRDRARWGLRFTARRYAATMELLLAV
jgi:hypothetical protein